MRLLLGTILVASAFLMWSSALPPLAITTAMTAGFLALVAGSWPRLALGVTLLALIGVTAIVGLVDLRFVPQVLDLANANADPIALLSQGNLWGPRYAIIYPSVALASQSRVGLDEAFTAYGAGLLTIEAFTLMTTVREANRANDRQIVLPGLVLGLMVAAVATGMNGRLIPAHLGMSLVLLAQTRVFLRQASRPIDWCLMAVGLFLALMTTGTVVAAALQVVVGTLLIQRTFRVRTRIATFAVLTVLTLLFGTIIAAGVEKNIEFFSTGSASTGSLADALPGLLSHGLGWFLLTTPLAGAVAILLLALATLLLLPRYLRLARSGDGLTVAFLCVPIALATGEFGYSTLTMGLPAVEIIVASAICRLIAAEGSARSWPSSQDFPAAEPRGQKHAS